MVPSDTSPAKPSKPIIGIAGGIASGKSTVAAMLGELGAGVIHSDRINHALLDDDDVLRQLRGWWGDSVVTPDGKADRAAIRKIVVNDSHQRERLEQLVHPRIAQCSEALIRHYQSDPDIKAVAWDAPLLFEVGIARKCDVVVFVEADDDLRRRRACRQRGWSEETLKRFEKSQWPLDEKRRRADYIISSNSDVDDLREQVTGVFSRILARFSE